ncbi:maleylpyruvate isomerase family mycothiol-dependent enzyme [Streptomonospora salina]
MSRLADALNRQTDGVLALARGADLDRTVPTCPDWDLRDLLHHLGQAHRFAADTVRRQVLEPGDLAGPADLAAPDGTADLQEWLAAGPRELVEAVDAAGADQPVWNWSGEDQRAGFWLRRMAHETAVHRVDAALAVGAPYETDTELAADGISEWLALVASPGAAAGRPEMIGRLRGQGQTLHLHATDSPGPDTAGEWLIRRGEDAVTYTHEHRTADVAVRGPAGDLLLALLGRIPPDDERIDVLGDTALLDHWQRNAAF